MAVQYVIKLYDDAGVPIGIVTPLDIAVVHKVNTPSVATFSVNLNAPVVKDLDAGYIIEIVRSDVDADMQAYTEFTGFIRFWDRSYGQNPIMSVTAIDAKCILQSRIVAWYPNLLGVSFFKTATYPTASSILTNLWNYNIGSLANGNPPVITADLTRRYGSNLARWTDGRITTATNATNLSIGDAIEVSCSGENVYDTMVKVADIGSLDFTVNFNISTLGYSLFYADNLGANRTATVKFSQQNNTVGNLSRSTNIMNYASLYHAVGSKGKDKNPIRTIYPTTAPTGVALREAYVKGADQTNTNQLRNLSYARFRRQRFLIQSYDIEVLQSAAWRYGRDYYLGDLVSVVTNITTTITRKIFAVSLSMNSQGVEEVRIDLAAN
jgi:hypothetical protein